MTKRAPTRPRDRILDAAEQAVANRGFDGASLRQISAGARVNLASIYYYFQSKEGLMAAVCERRFGPLWQELRQSLEALGQEMRRRPVQVEEVLEAMLLPSLHLAASASEHGQGVMRLVGRIVAEPNAWMQRLLSGRRRELRGVQLAVLRRCLPHLTETDLHWRTEFVWGALALLLCNPAKLEIVTGGLCNPQDTRAVLAQMIRFFSAGFRAPSLAASPAQAGRHPPRLATSPNGELLRSPADFSPS